LLLDEPTASLDPETASWIRHFLKSYCKERGATILLASHDMREVELICDDVLLLRRGKLVERGSPVDLLKRFGRKTLEDVFLDVARGQNGEAA
jgi:ABC-2 type transport system ATP-binding protein